MLCRRSTITLIAAFSLSPLAAAPGTVNTILPSITEGSGGLDLEDFDYFANSMCSLGDLDGDGVDDLAVGAMFDDTGAEDAGAVHLLFLNEDSSVRASTKIAHGSGGLSLAEGDAFGRSVAALGDLDGDGVTDLAVGAYFDDAGGAFGSDRGAVHILFLNADGTVKATAKIADGSGSLSLGDDDFFGIGLATLGDLDGDGVTELVVGTAGDNTGGSDRGAIHILFLNQDGSVKVVEKIAHGSGGLALSDGDGFGSSCTSIGDRDGDGIPEIAVGALMDDTGGTTRGAVHIVFLNVDASVKSSSKIAHGTGGLSLADSDAFGTTCASLGDLDGDGIGDLGVGAPGDDTGGGARGAVHLIFLNGNSSVKSLAKIAHGSGALTLDNNENFGFSILPMGDPDDDHIANVAVGAIANFGVSTLLGGIHLLEIGDAPLVVNTLADEFDLPSGATLSLREAIRDADATGEFRTILFDDSLNGATLELDAGRGPLAPSSQSLRITGEGLDGGLTLSGQGQTQLFSLTTATVTVDQMNLRDGFSASGGGICSLDSNSRLVLDRVTLADGNGSTAGGGAVRCSGSLSVTDSTFLENTAEFGGAILVDGLSSRLSVINGTFARNAATGSNDGGGAIFFSGAGALARIRYSTFVENSTNEIGGAIRSDAGVVIVADSLFAGNSAVVESPDYDIGITEAGGIATVDLSDLLNLGDYGGPTPVQPLKPSSTAKGTATHLPLPENDQRGEGFPRTVGTGRDPGAVEGTEETDFQPDGRIGLKSGSQSGNNRYNLSGQGQTAKVTLSGRKKTKSYFTVENDGSITDAIQLRSTPLSKKTLKAKVYRLTGGRTNVTSQLFTSGLALGNLAPGSAIAFQADWSRKSATKKAKQTVKITARSGAGPKSDVIGAKMKSK